jgi:hypothetical protein
MFFDTETLRFWNGRGDLDFNGDTYTGAANLLKIGNIEETKGIKASGTKLVLNGVPASLRQTVTAEDIQGRKVKVYFGAFDSSGNIISDPVVIFSGKADVPEIELGGKTMTISLTVESDLRALRRVNERRYTSEDQQAKYPNDVGLEFVTSIQDKDIIWSGDNA